MVGVTEPSRFTLRGAVESELHTANTEIIAVVARKEWAMNWRRLVYFN